MNCSSVSGLIPSKNTDKVRKERKSIPCKQGKHAGIKLRHGMGAGIYMELSSIFLEPDADDKQEDVFGAKIHCEEVSDEDRRI